MILRVKINSLRLRYFHVSGSRKTFALKRIEDVLV